MLPHSALFRSRSVQHPESSNHQTAITNQLLVIHSVHRSEEHIDVVGFTHCDYCSLVAIAKLVKSNSSSIPFHANEQVHACE